MERLKKYQKILTEYLNDYHHLRAKAAKDDLGQVITDTKKNQYQYSLIGWNENVFYFEVFFHFAIIENQVWIQRNLTEAEVDQELIKRGVDAKDIVLGFVPKEVRQMLDDSRSLENEEQPASA